MYRRQYGEPVTGGKSYYTEVAGRDRFLFFRRPVEGDGINNDNTMNDNYNNNNTTDAAHPSNYNDSHIRYASSCPPTPPEGGAAAGGRRIGNNNKRNRAQAGLDLTNTGAGNLASSYNQVRIPAAAAASNNNNNTRKIHSASSASGKTRARNFHLPPVNTNNNNNNNANNNVGDSVNTSQLKSARTRDAITQSDYRENEAQTLPYSPDYFISDDYNPNKDKTKTGNPAELNPEIYYLQGLTVANGGLPAGKTEIELIERLRRRRALQMEVAEKTAAGTMTTEEKFRRLHALEEEEWAEREAHTAALQERRLDALREALSAREAENAAAAQRRINSVAAQQLGALAGTLEKQAAKGASEAKRNRAVQQTIDFTQQRNAALIAAAANASEAADPNRVARRGGGGNTGNVAAHYYNQNRALVRYKPKEDLVESYTRYGVDAAPPVVRATTLNNNDNNNNNTTVGSFNKGTMNSSRGMTGGVFSSSSAGNNNDNNGGAAPVVAVTLESSARRVPENYDIRPTLLSDAEGVAHVSGGGSGSKKRSAKGKFNSSTLHQQREQQNVQDALEHVYTKIQNDKALARAAAAATLPSENGSAAGTTTTNNNNNNNNLIIPPPIYEGDASPDYHTRQLALEGANNNNNTGDAQAAELAALTAAAAAADPKLAKRLERQRILGLYRTTPKVERPATPVLELDGDESEEEEENIILLQRLMRGRAVQNDFFEGKERCRGLITELQAASNIDGNNNTNNNNGGVSARGLRGSARGAATATATAEDEGEWALDVDGGEMNNNNNNASGDYAMQDPQSPLGGGSLSPAVPIEADPERFYLGDDASEARADYFTANVTAAAAGEIIADTLAYLHGELGRQRDALALRQLHDAAAARRLARESEERERRAAQVRERARRQAQYVALVGVARRTIGAALPSLLLDAVRETALAEAVEEEKGRLSRLAPPDVYNYPPLYVPAPGEATEGDDNHNNNNNNNNNNNDNNNHNNNNNSGGDGDGSAAAAAEEARRRPARAPTPTQPEKDVACDLLDKFIIDAVLDSEARAAYRNSHEKPTAAAALDVANTELALPLQRGGGGSNNNSVRQHNNNDNNNNNNNNNNTNGGRPYPLGGSNNNSSYSYNNNNSNNSNGDDDAPIYTNLRQSSRGGRTPGSGGGSSASSPLAADTPSNGRRVLSFHHSAAANNNSNNNSVTVVNVHNNNNNSNNNNDGSMYSANSSQNSNVYHSANGTIVISAPHSPSNATAAATAAASVTSVSRGPLGGAGNGGNDENNSNNNNNNENNNNEKE